MAREKTGDMILGRYQVRETNVDGGFGTVSICWDTRLHRRVAIKTIPLHVDGGPEVPASTLEEALAEARATSLISHPNIVTVYDFEVAAGESHLVMEYVDGMNLAELLDSLPDGTLSFDETAHLVRSVAGALETAHENGMLHLDVKPANIMIDRRGNVKLGDFGMAALASAAGYGGARGGTVGYMPPEQIAGSLVDERSDIFSLAVVTWECLSGSSPFASSSAEGSLRAIERGPRDLLSAREPELGGVVEETLLCAMDPLPDNRMDSIREFEGPLLEFLGDASSGRETLRDVVLEALDDSPDPEDDEDSLEKPSLVERWPWLPDAAWRIARGIPAAIVVLACTRSMLPGSWAATCAASLATACAGALWAPLSAALSFASIIAAIALESSTHSAITCALAGTILLAWWILVGRKSDIASFSIALSAVAPSPVVAALGAAHALPPIMAACTGLVSWWFAQLFQTAVTLGFQATELQSAILALFDSPDFWIVSLAIALGSAAGSALGDTDSVPRKVLAEILCWSLVAFTQVAVWRMENGDIWTVELLPSVAIAVIFLVIVTTLTVLIGPTSWMQEGEDFA